MNLRTASVFVTYGITSVWLLQAGRSKQYKDKFQTNFKQIKKLYLTSWVSFHGLEQGCPHFFVLRATFKMAKSK